MRTFPKIETERLVLKKLRLSDTKLIAKYANNENISKFTATIPFPYLEEHATWWINNSFKGFDENTHHTFGIYLKSTNEFIGGISLVLNQKEPIASQGYWIAEPFWNKGFMTEANKAVIAYGFNELNLIQVYALHLDLNSASGKVMLKSGMLKEGELNNHNFKDGVSRFLYKYRILKSEFDLKSKS